MTTFESVVREYFPKATDEQVEYILWEHTGFPAFWDLEDGQTVEECLRKQLAELATKGEKP
jgi:hypothetical protein